MVSCSSSKSVEDKKLPQKQKTIQVRFQVLKNVLVQPIPNFPSNSKKFWIMVDTCTNWHSVLYK